ncbi:hypothetical protein Phum_PHUM592210 [Pediculus humanus corporis]|uniref:Uncharacterized protein n=1 Tax=Pediculus humanus subsp. corporis TaxID=121224 RepID=E0W2G9_PEDHC|nr:uncharacterized protein Phum_PHUM592210 [Pediculus humanus corporis]EEB19825.1 hypothetical protein Phum_PHUM592210 [Pediculus humanus corporis]
MEDSGIDSDPKNFATKSEGSQFQVKKLKFFLILNHKPTTVTKEHLPLVDWDTDESDEDIHFFPIKPPIRQELTDTFSIEEYQVSPDEDDLNLLPPLPTYQRLSLCCFSFNPKCVIL